MNIKIILISIIVILFVLVSATAWYLYNNLNTRSQQDYTAQENENAPKNSNYQSDTTVEISNELNQTPDDSSINKELEDLNRSVQGF